MVNSVILVGRAGRDPEMRYFESGRVKTTFSVAVNRPTKEKETDWFDIEIWGRQAEIAGEYVRKGSLIGVEGRLDFSRWTDDQGNKNVRPYVHATGLRLLGSANPTAAAAVVVTRLKEWNSQSDWTPASSPPTLIGGGFFS